MNSAEIIRKVAMMLSINCGVTPENSLGDKNVKPKADNNPETNNNCIHIPLSTIPQHSAVNESS